MDGVGGWAVRAAGKDQPVTASPRPRPPLPHLPHPPPGSGGAVGESLQFVDGLDGPNTLQQSSSIQMIRDDSFDIDG